MEVVADREKCIGAGNCVWGAEGYFDQDDLDGKVIVLRSTIDPADDERVRTSAGLCPVAALHLT
jgi:ferredoxin